MKPILEHKPAYIALLSLLILFLPISFVHEVGHILVCVSDGFSYSMTFTIVVAGVSCHGTPNNLVLYWAFGGVLAMIVTLAPFIGWKWLKHNKGIMIGLLTLTSGHGVNAIIETFWHIWYLENMKYANMLVMIPSVIAFFVYLFLFARIRR